MPYQVKIYQLIEPDEETLYETMEEAQAEKDQAETLFGDSVKIEIEEVPEEVVAFFTGLSKKIEEVRE